MSFFLTKKQKKQLTWYAIGVVVLVTMAVFFLVQSGDAVFFELALRTYLAVWWIVLPVPLWLAFLATWGTYKGTMWAMKQEKIILEVKPPADTERSPKIMEQVINGFHTYSGLNKFDEYCGWRPSQDTYSLELVSTEGVVHFYIRCPKAARNTIEAHIYAQYPDAEIFEVEDYTKKVPKNLPNPQWDVYGASLLLLKEDALPIRTYQYFKEEVTGQMIDPLASVTEVFSNFSKNQHGWFQIMITPIQDKIWKPKSDKFLNELIGRKEKKEVKKINPVVKILYRVFGELFVIPINVIKALFTSDGELISAGELEDPADVPEEFNINKLSPDIQEKVKAVYENMSKPAFVTGMRYVYLGKKENYNKALGVGGFFGAMNQFVDINLNSLYPENKTKTFANYYFTKSRLEYRQRKVIANYRDRDRVGLEFIFNTEELATIFHFPDVSVKAPNIQRIEAKKGEAPSNLPIDFEIE